MNFEELYFHICGAYIINDESLNLFTKDSHCSQLYKSAYNLKQSLNLRLGREEDPELYELLDIYEEIQKCVAKKVFEVCNKE